MRPPRLWRAPPPADLPAGPAPCGARPAAAAAGMGLGHGLARRGGRRASPRGRRRARTGRRGAAHRARARRSNSRPRRPAAQSPEAPTRRFPRLFPVVPAPLAEAPTPPSPAPPPTAICFWRTSGPTATRSHGAPRLGGGTGCAIHRWAGAGRDGAGRGGAAGARPRQTPPAPAGAAVRRPLAAPHCSRRPRGRSRGPRGAPQRRPALTAPRAVRAPPPGAAAIAKDPYAEGLSLGGPPALDWTRVCDGGSGEIAHARPRNGAPGSCPAPGTAACDRGATQEPIGGAVGRPSRRRRAAAPPRRRRLPRAAAPRG
jgi:hypothetical protein